MVPMAEAEAIAEPAIAPIIMADTMLINANPPGKKPTNVLAKDMLISKFAGPQAVGVLDLLYVWSRDALILPDYQDVPKKRNLNKT